MNQKKTPSFSSFHFQEQILKHKNFKAPLTVNPRQAAPGQLCNLCVTTWEISPCSQLAKQSMC